MKTYVVNHNFDTRRLDRMSSLYVYNGLDCVATAELLEVLKEHPDRNARLMYKFTRGLQGPVLEIMRRGIRVDIAARQETVQFLEKEESRVESHLNKLAHAIWGKDLNPRSPAQLKEFFYTAMDLPPQYRIAKGEKKISTDRKCLEALRVYFYAQIFVNHILKLRDLRKLLGTLRSQVEPNRRMVTSFHVAGTETWRFSSSANAFGRGTNFQNLTDRVRRIFIADPGYKLAYIDLEQAESRTTAICAYLVTGLLNYYNACISGDLHTSVTKLVWPELPWTGVLKDDKEVAETKFYRHFTYRYMSKKGGHGSNYGGKAYTIAKEMHVSVPTVQNFQASYFEAFPEIAAYQKDVELRLQRDGYIIHPLGAKRRFWDRVDSHDTIKEAIAFGPQSMVGILLNLGLYRVWKHLRGFVQILAQVHDAILIQYPEDREAEAIEATQNYIEVDVPIDDNITLRVPSSCEGVGWNWGKVEFDKITGGISDNPSGLMPLKGPDLRERPDHQEPSVLDRRLL